MKKVTVNNRDHLCLFATRDIGEGEELRYSYIAKEDDDSELIWRKVCDGISLKFPFLALVRI